MEKVPIVPLKEKISVSFEHLPSYASRILHHELEDFVRELIRLYRAHDVPLLRFFQSMSDDQLFALSLASTREMLTLLAANRADEYIGRTINNWITNQLPLITREQVDAQDITLVNYVRGTVFRQFIPRYTQDPEVGSLLVEELDRFTVILNSELLSAFMDLQKQELRSLNAALSKREQQLLEAQEIGQIGSFEWDFSGRQSSYTPQMFRIFEMEGPSNISSFINDVHPEDQEKVRSAIEKAMVDGNYECEYRYARNNKEKVIYSLGKVQFQEGKPVRMIGTITDVTERHEIIKKLQRSEELHKQAQALTHIGNWSWIVDEDRITWSDEMYRIYGLQPQSETITFQRFISFIHPDDRDQRISEVQRSLETLKVHEYHFRILSNDGKTKILRGKGDVESDSSGKPLIMLGTCQDVTREYTLTQQLKEREKYLEELNQSLEFANAELRRTNEELESFNFIASHDLQEPLRKIQVYSNRILETGADALPPPFPDYFTRINNASKRMQKLIEDFLSFSQTFKSRQSPEHVDLNVIMDEILAELSTRIEEKAAEIVVVYPLPSLLAVPFQIKQLMINLLSNSLKYTHAGISPCIKVAGSVVTGEQVPASNANPSLQYAMVSVRDNGIGFEAKYSTRIFELFQRLHNKDVYSGTGIGLALCKKIVQSMHGYIIAEGMPDQGSVFTFYLPLAAKAPQLRR